MAVFGDLLHVLKREKTGIPVPFEFIIDDSFLLKAAGISKSPSPGSREYFLMVLNGFRNLGYPCATVPAWHTRTLNFLKAESHSKSSRSQNVPSLISNEESFRSYPWPDPANGDYEIYNYLSDHLPEGMKLMACSDGGLLENATDIIGFENLCMMYLLQPDLTREIFDRIGNALVTYYEIVSSFPSVGVCMINDDWGFKTQTMFPPEMMREYIFPWIKKMVRAVHDNGKPAILHSCGNLGEIMDEVIHDLGFDGKHSYEDTIHPVEEAYGLWGNNISIMGGLDVDFLCRENPENIRKRCRNMLEITADRGGYALGSGNSIPKWMPEENFMAMLSVLKEYPSL